MTSEMEKRVAKAIEDTEFFLNGSTVPTRVGSGLSPKLAASAIAAVADDPDIQEILRWLDFKSCGWAPDEDTYKGARKLLDAFQIKDSGP